MRTNIGLAAVIALLSTTATVGGMATVASAADTVISKDAPDLKAVRAKIKANANTMGRCMVTFRK